MDEKASKPTPPDPNPMYIPENVKNALRQIAEQSVAPLYGGWGISEMIWQMQNIAEMATALCFELGIPYADDYDEEGEEILATEPYVHQD